MTSRLTVERNKAGLEDLLFGTGTEEQSRGGTNVTVTKINAENLPFDASRTLAQAITDLGDYNTFLTTYGATLTELQDNLQALLDINTAIIGPAGNATYLESQTLAQVRANIDALTLGGQTLSQVRANINAAELEGSNLAAVRANINAAELEGSNLAAVRANINAAQLSGQTLAQVRAGIDASLLEGQSLSQVRANIDAATLGGLTPAQIQGDTSRQIKMLMSGVNDSGQVYAGNNFIIVNGNNEILFKGDGSLYANGTDYNTWYYDWISIPMPNECKDKTIRFIKGGYYSFYVVYTDGTLVSWGYNNRGQLGQGNTTNNYTPTIVSGINVDKLFVCATTGNISWASVYAITNTGQLYAWGGNAYGQLGTGDNVNKSSPTLVNVDNKTVTYVATADNLGDCCVLCSDGTVYSAGRNAQGALGHGNTTSLNVFTQIAGLGSKTVTKVYGAGGYAHSGSHHHRNNFYFLTDEKKVYATGYNGSGEVGNNSTTQANTPVLLNYDFTTTGKGVTKLFIEAAGAGSHYFINEDGDLYGWGYNGYGQLGQNNTTNQLSPILIASNVSDVYIAGGGDYSLACTCIYKTTSNVLYSMGYNSNAQCGLGHNDAVNQPTEVLFSYANLIDSYMGVGYGSDYCFIFRLTDGRMYGWGDNGHARLVSPDRTWVGRPTQLPV